MQFQTDLINLGIYLKNMVSNLPWLSEAAHEVVTNPEKKEQICIWYIYIDWFIKINFEKIITNNNTLIVDKSSLLHYKYGIICI